MLQKILNWVAFSSQFSFSIHFNLSFGSFKFIKSSLILAEFTSLLGSVQFRRSFRFLSSMKFQSIQFSFKFIHFRFLSFNVQFSSLSLALVAVQFCYSIKFIVKYLCDSVAQSPKSNNFISSLWKGARILMFLRRYGDR